VAPWLGFQWSNPDADAAWSTAQLHRARATDDAAERQRLLDEVARYNADDLWAMRVVWRWLERHGG
jgi:predicted RecB family nuclease